MFPIDGSAPMCFPFCWPFADVWLEDAEDEPRIKRRRKKRRHRTTTRKVVVSLITCEHLAPRMSLFAFVSLTTPVTSSAQPQSCCRSFAFPHIFSHTNILTSRFASTSSQTQPSSCCCCRHVAMEDLGSMTYADWCRKKKVKEEPPKAAEKAASDGDDSDSFETTHTYLALKRKSPVPQAAPVLQVVPANEVRPQNLFTSRFTVDSHQAAARIRLLSIHIPAAFVSRARPTCGQATACRSAAR